jgi:teichuronic acid biosynthesis glycosyltransferase TuaG
MPNSDSLVSVIIPAYNAQNYISDAITSVRNQTWKRWELIIVNDGSTDATATIVADFCRQDPGIQLISRENGKQAKARNTGIAAASGQFLAFLDSDDIWHPLKLEKQLAAHERTQADVVFTDAIHFSDEAIRLPTDLFGLYNGFFRGDEMFLLLFKRNAIPLSSALLSRKRVGTWCYFDEDVKITGVEDFELWLRLASKDASFLGMPDKLIKYRSHSEQTSQDSSSMMSATNALRRKYRAAWAMKSISHWFRGCGVVDISVGYFIESCLFHYRTENIDWPWT